MVDYIDKLNILAINEFDLLGRRFNGYDMIEHINNNTDHIFNQMVIHKLSNDKNVYKFFEGWKVRKIEDNCSKFEQEILSVHSQFSITADIISNVDIFKNSNVIHYHMIHNTRIPLPSLTHLFNLKPTVITIHDPWNFTGRCVHPFECDEWKNGCKKCDYLDTTFPFKFDNCKYLWNQKEKMAKEWDVDIIVATEYLDETFMKQSPITKHFKNVHILPFGIDLDLFKDNNNKYEIREKLNIPKDDIVIFLRSQKEFKCAKEIKEALKILESDKSITIISCSEVGNFDDLKGKYNFVELGSIEELKIIETFNACDFFLMPTKGESFGLMAVEAMACSRAVVIFDNMTLPQITFAPECGVLVENLNVKKLAEAIKFLIDNEDERVRRGKLGREVAEKYYDVKKFNENIIRIYEKAFERQKYKLENKSVTRDFDYDINNISVRKLIYAINKHYKLIFGNEKVDFNFDFEIKNDEFNDNIYTSIDYSNNEVLKFINYFNNTVYLHYKHMIYNNGANVSNNDEEITLVNNTNVSTLENKNKLFKLYYYARYETYKLKEDFKGRLLNKPKLYAFIKKSYNTIKKFKSKF